MKITESEDGNITVTLSLNPDNFKNPGQAKKMLKIKDKEPTTEAGNETAVSDQTRAGKEKNTKNNGENKIREKKAGERSDKINKGSDKEEDEFPGKSNGKKNE